MAANQVSHTAWAVNDKSEPWSFLDANIGMTTGGWSTEDLSTRGQVIKDLCLNWDDTVPPPLPDGIAGHWKLDEDGGTTTADKTSNGNDGTFGGDPQWAEGKFGSALTLDGDDYVDLGNPSDLDVGTSDFTLCAWVKNPVGGSVIGKGGDDGGGIKTSVSGGSGLQDGLWHHVAGVRDGDTLRVFIDSVEVGSEPLPYPGYNLSGTSQHNAYIGALWLRDDNQPGKYFTGSVDDVRIYVGSLTSTELAEVMLDCGLDAPTGLSATGGDATVSLDWDDSAEGDLDGYNVYRSTTSGSGYSQIKSDVADSDYVDNTAVSCVAYFYVVTVVNTYECESGYSNEVFSRPTGSIAAGDVNRDCRVDIDDVIQLSGDWLTAEPSSDIAPLPVVDGTVNLLDFTMIGQNWMNRYTSELLVIDPAGVTTSSAYSVATLGAGILNGSGLSDGEHDSVFSNMWVSTGIGYGGEDTDPSVTFDLGAVHNISRIYVWNYNQAGFSARGINGVSVEYGITAALGSTVAGITNFAEATGSDGYAGEEFDTFTEFSARYIKFDIDSNHGDGNSFYGLSEVQFYD
ncbi:MAG: hypothetical protein FVQ79_01595 [Planctomycetes bacterium]|nr:hypothetical protein [Planctomycetota bacterium]